MIHAFAYIIFILPFTAWLGAELHRTYSLRAHWRWLVAAFVIGVIGSQIFRIYPDNFGNFLLHTGGGMSATCLFFYTFKTLKLKLNWRLTLLMLFAFVSMLGVLNELAEYFFESLGYGVFSYDTHDTWRDLAANTTGMLVAWTAVRLHQILYTKR